MRTRIAFFVALFLAGGAMSGCLYTDIRVPRAYRSSTPSDVKAATTDTQVSGQACYRSVLYLIAWGDGGYAAATRDALKHSPGAVLYDVKVDISARSFVLGMYARNCTVVSGRIGSP